MLSCLANKTDLSANSGKTSGKMNTLFRESSPLSVPFFTAPVKWNSWLRCMSPLSWDIFCSEDDPSACSAVGIPWDLDPKQSGRALYIT